MLDRLYISADWEGPLCDIPSLNQNLVGRYLERNPDEAPDGADYVVAKNQTGEEGDCAAIGAETAVSQNDSFNCPTDKNWKPEKIHVPTQTPCAEYITDWMQDPPKKPHLHGCEEHGETEAYSHGGHRGIVGARGVD